MATTKNALIALINSSLASGSDINAAELRDVLIQIVQSLAPEVVDDFENLDTTGGTRFIIVNKGGDLSPDATMYFYEADKDQLYAMAAYTV